MGQVGLDDMALFVRVALAGGVRAAARDGGDSRSLLSRRLAGLEDRLGVRLVVRDTLHFTLTDAGRVFLEHAERVVAAARAAEDAARAAVGKVRGRLRVACSPVLAEVAVEELVCEYLARYPEAGVDLHVAAERIDLRAHRIDLAFRTAPLRAEGSMRQRRLAQSRVALVASPEYLAVRGTPKTVAELAEHDAILVGTAASFPLAEGKVVMRDRLRVNGYTAARKAALAGLGIAWFSTVYARAELARGDLQVVLPETAMLSTVHAVMPGTGTLPAKVRAFLDLAVQRITSERLMALVAMVVVLALSAGCGGSEPRRVELPIAPPPVTRAAPVDAGVAPTLEGDWFPLVAGSRRSYRAVFEGKTMHTVVETRRLAETSRFYFIAIDGRESQDDPIVGTAMPGGGIYEQRGGDVYTGVAFWLHDLAKTAPNEPFLARRAVVGHSTTIEVTFPTTFVVRGLGSVTVPAGSWSDALFIDFETEKLNGEIVLVRGIGLVKWKRHTGRIDELESFQP